MRWAEREASRQSAKDYPEDVTFYDFERAVHIYTLLEGFSDGMGGWRFVDVLGQPLLELDEALVEDLVTLRHLRGISDQQRSAKKDGANGG